LDQQVISGWYLPDISVFCFHCFNWGVRDKTDAGDVEMVSEKIDGSADLGWTEAELDASDPRQQMLAAPLSRFQKIAIGITTALCALDGFDVLAITYAAPALLDEWGINRAQLGWAISAGLLGMALGSFFLSPVADTIGRRRMVILSLVIMIVGTLWTALSGGLTELVLSRILTGLGVGSMIAVIVPMSSEYANARRRDLAVSLMTIGYPIGGILGGLLSSVLLASMGWRAIFFFASAIGVVLLLIVLRFLLEPLALVVARPGKNGLARANLYLSRCGRPLIERLPPPPIATNQLPIKSLFKPGMAGDTIKITLIYFLYMIPQFYMQTWLPTLVADVGLSASQAALVAAFMSVGGVVAGLFIAGASLRVGIKRIELIMLAGAGIVTACFAFLPGILAVMIGGALIAGFFVMGGMIGLYAIIARTFPAHLRASGTGFVIGIGRVGSILPPMIAGMLFTSGMGRESISILMAAPAIVCLLLLLTFRVRPPTTA
jgi:AAHS family 4-hydroxybenzoate transporter-like MFS transporter